MTVRELRKHLENYDPELEVVVEKADISIEQEERTDYYNETPTLVQSVINFHGVKRVLIK